MLLSSFWKSAVEMSLWSKRGWSQERIQMETEQEQALGLHDSKILLWKMFSHCRQGPLLSHSKDKLCKWPQGSRIQPCVLACLEWPLTTKSSVKVSLSYSSFSVHLISSKICLLWPLNPTCLMPAFNKGSNRVYTGCFEVTIKLAEEKADDKCRFLLFPCHKEDP